MNIQKRIQDAMKRRHQNEDGFTLIELLVVILIIAILAAVAIFALLSSLGSAKKSNAKETVRAAQSSLTATQSGLGDTDFSGITVSQATANPTSAGTGTLDKAEKDVYFTTAALTSASSDKVVSMTKNAANTQVTLVSRDEDGNCFYIELNKSSATRYGAHAAGTAACPAAPTTVAYNNSQKAGWKL